MAADDGLDRNPARGRLAGSGEVVEQHEGLTFGSVWCRQRDQRRTVGGRRRSSGGHDGGELGSGEMVARVGVCSSGR